MTSATRNSTPTTSRNPATRADKAQATNHKAPPSSNANDAPTGGMHTAYLTHLIQTLFWRSLSGLVLTAALPLDATLYPSNSVASNGHRNGRAKNTYEPYPEGERPSTTI